MKYSAVEIFVFVIILCIKLISGIPLKEVSFPNDSDESSGDFIYGNVKATIRPSSKRFIKKTVQKDEFRFDAENVSCKNSTMPFCEQITEQVYPSEYVEQKLQSTGQLFTDYFNKTLNVSDLIGERIFTQNGPIELCESYKKLIYPRLAMNINYDWRFVINQPNYQQPIQVEICQHKSRKCLFDDSYPNGYISMCTQKYTIVPLLSLDEKGEIVFSNYEMPSFCKCEIFERS